MGNNEVFLKVAGKMPYLESGKTILEKFGSLIAKLVKRLANMEGIEENSVALQAIEKGFSFITMANPQVKVLPKVEAKPEYDIKDGTVSPDNDEGPVFDEEGRVVDPNTSYQPEMSDPTVVARNENTQDLIPLMGITKNKCE
jgi:hypothetical protein